MATRLKICPACGHLKHMGQSKSRCKPCRAAGAPVPTKAQARKAVRRFRSFSTVVRTYAQRDEIVRFLGFENYGQYLASPLWAGIRAQSIRFYGGRCRLCGSFATEVHHLTYDLSVMKSFTPSMMAPLCRACHQRIEFDDLGNKRTLCDVGNAYDLLCQHHDKIHRSSGDRVTSSRIGSPAVQPPGDSYRLTVCLRCGERQSCGELLVCRSCAVEIRIGRCVGCGRDAKIGRQWCRRCSGKNSIVVTESLLYVGRTDKGGYTREQLAILGVSWPPYSGWLHDLVGSTVSGEAARAFVDSRNKSLRKSRCEACGQHARKGSRFCTVCEVYYG